MRHVYECPVRYADIDPLGHVNNVVYVDYLQEARVDMLRVHAPDSRVGEATDDLAEALVVVRHEVHYRSPLKYQLRPVSIECWVTEVRAASFTMAYEVFHDDDTAPGGRRVYVQATTVLTPFVFGSERPRRVSAEERAALATYLEEAPPWAAATRPRLSSARHDDIGHDPVQVRFSDVDVYGHVNNVKYFDYFMEARIRFRGRLLAGLPELQRPFGMVVAQTDVDYRLPILFRAEPYDTWSWLSHVGDRSVVVESEICDGDTVLSRARVVMVFFDRTTQHSMPPPGGVRDRLLAAPGVS